MKKSAWLSLFFVSLTCNLAGTYYQHDVVVGCSKPLIVISLFCWFLSYKTAVPKRILLPAAIALLCSLLGDILLVFDKLDTLFFIAGLVCFLIAHIFYIVCFNRLRLVIPQQLRWWIIPPVMIYYCTLIFILFPHLGDMKLPVLIYGAVISSMFYVALHLLFGKGIYLKWIVLGAVLFVVSDSLLALNKFYSPFKYAGVFIMLTYGLAQYFITRGIIGDKNNTIISTGS